MEQAAEYTERSLEQEILRLKAEGKSIREIAEAVGKPPTTVHRLLAKMEQNEANEEQSAPPVEQPDITLAVALVIDSYDEENIAAVLRRVEEEEEGAAQALREARTREADAHQRLEDAAQRAALARDAVDRAQVQQAIAMAKADAIEANVIAATRERAHAEVHSLLTRLQQRQRELVEAQVEREINGLVNGAREKLSATQQAFISGIREVQQVLAEAKGRAADLPRLAADLELNSTVPLDSLVQVVGALAIGQRRAVNGYCRVKLVKWWRGHPAGNVMETDARHGQELWLSGYAEAPQAI